MTPYESAVIVAVPAAEAAVGRVRAELDRSAQWGVPAHVTVLYPFVPPKHIDNDVVAVLAAAIGTVPAFDVTFSRVGWFGDGVAWLAPEPDQPFRALTAAVWQRFPDRPPYRGAFDDVVPHLTIGHDAPVTVLRPAADAVAARLPIQARVAAAQLIQGSHEPDSWRTVAELALGQPVATSR
jgi:2'-5' RNA ligase